MEFKMLCLCIIVCFSALIQQVRPSAIPMWEFLSKDEKRSFLYSLFANQVEELCEDSREQRCSQELLKYGLDTLKDMSEEDLDKLDPYQRGANNLVWESLMNGHNLQKTTPKPRITTTAKPNSYDDQSFAEEFGSQSEASAKLEGIRVLPPKDFVYKMETDTPQYVYPNQIQYFDKQKSGGLFAEFHNQHTSTDRQAVGTYETEVPLTGPLVVKVYPDGRPVGEPYRPHDEDLRQYQLSKTKLPNL